MKLRKRDRIGLLIIAVLFGLMQLFLQLIYINAKTTCANFTKLGGTRSVDSYHYIYRMSNITYENHISEGFLKLRDLDSLKKIECVQIEYSIYFPSYSRVIDKRILK